MHIDCRLGASISITLTNQYIYRIPSHFIRIDTSIAWCLFTPVYQHGI